MESDVFEQDGSSCSAWEQQDPHPELASSTDLSDPKSSLGSTFCLAEGVELCFVLWMCSCWGEEGALGWFCALCGSWFERTATTTSPPWEQTPSPHNLPSSAASLGIPNIPQAMLALIFTFFFCLVATELCRVDHSGHSCVCSPGAPTLPQDQLPCWILQRDGNVVLRPYRRRWDGHGQRKSWQKYGNLQLLVHLQEENQSKVNEQVLFFLTNPPFSPSRFPVKAIPCLMQIDVKCISLL